MAEVTINRLGDEAQHDNQMPPMSAIRQYDKPLSTRRSPAETRTNIVFGGLAALVLLGTLALIRLASCWNVSDYDPTFGCTLSNVLFWFYVIAAPVTAVAWAALTLYWNHQRAQAEVARSMVTRDRYDNPVSAAMVLGKPYELAWNELLLAAQTDVATAPYRQLPVGLDSLSVTQTNSSTAKAGDVAALVTGTPDVGPLPVSEWMQWVDRRPHLMLAAETGGGKSTTAKAVLAPRISGGESVFVIDPHSSEWFDLPSVGGGEDWGEVETAMMAVVREYRNRLAEREAHLDETGKELPVEHFPRLTVLLDESNNTKAHFDRHHKNKPTNPWTLFAQVLGSGARKVRISVILLAQSSVCEDLGLSGPMRQNFTRIALDDRTIRQLVDEVERSKERKEAIFERMAELDYPAASVVNSRVCLLDRTGLDEVPAPSNSQAAAWAGWDYKNGVPVHQGDDGYAGPFAFVRGENPETAVLQGITNERTRTNGGVSMTHDEKLALLRALRKSGMTRKQARDLLTDYREGFTDTDWTLAGE